MKKFNLRLATGLKALMTIDVFNLRYVSMKKNTLFLVIFLLLFSCVKHEKSSNLSPLIPNSIDSTTLIVSELNFLSKNTTNIATIEIPESFMSFASDGIVDSYRYIQLETSDQCLIGNINRIYADSVYYFIFDQTNNVLFTFTKEGKYVNQIGQEGRGAHEYFRIGDFAVDKVRKELCIYDVDGLKLIYFDYTGNYLRNKPIYYRFSQLAFLQDNIVCNIGFGRNKKVPQIDLSQLVISELDQTPIAKGFEFKELSPEFHICPGSQLHVSFDKLYFNEFRSDTIWEIRKDGFDAKYVLRPPAGFKNEYIYPQLTNANLRELDKGSVYYNSHFITSNDFSVFGINDNDRFRSLIYCHNTQNFRYGMIETSIFSTSIGLHLLTEFVPTYADGDEFIVWCQPSYFLNSGIDHKQRGLKIDKQDQQLLDNLSEEDNPVLMLVKLKDF